MRLSSGAGVPNNPPGTFFEASVSPSAIQYVQSFDTGGQGDPSIAGTVQDSISVRDRYVGKVSSGGMLRVGESA